MHPRVATRLWIVLLGPGPTAACAGAADPGTAGGSSVVAPAEPPRRVPQLVVGVAFPGRDEAPHRAMSAAAAGRLRARIRAEGAAQGAHAEGHRGWFFHAFDARSLQFMIGRFHRRCAGLGCQDYVIESI